MNSLSATYDKLVNIGSFLTHTATVAYSMSFERPKGKTYKVVKRLQLLVNEDCCSP